MFADAAFASDREFVGDLHNEILHQDTCNESTHEGVPLLAVLAADDRVPAAGEQRSRASVEAVLPQLLARWETECVTVRIALAAIAAAFPSADASQDLLPGLRMLAGRYPGRTLPGDYVRLAGTIAVGKRGCVLTAVEALTGQNWSPTVRSAPLTGRALHLLDQMLSRLRASAKAEGP